MFKRLVTQLTALQQEGYQTDRFLSWWLKHWKQSAISQKKPLVWTQKVKNILLLATIVLLIATAVAIRLSFWLTILLLVVSWWQPWLWMVLGVFILKPYEWWNKNRVMAMTREKILSQKDMVVIGITGSFGKTSVKEILFTLLDEEGKTVKTPESYNTIFGIKKVVEFEILKKTKKFICEMGAYTRGEIVELCRMVPPKFAILTAVGTQHLEHFGSLKNTTLAKFELVDAVEPQNALVNLDNDLIKEHLKLTKYAEVKTYSLNNTKADFYLKDFEMSKKGIIFQLGGTKYEADLFGTVNLSNLLAAVSMARMVGVSEKKIASRLKLVRPVAHRLELKQIGNCTLIDNAFSSNETGFKTTLEDLRGLRGKKAIITPGIIELGNRTAEVHKQLGELADGVFDKYILVGRSERTMSFESGLKDRKKIEYVSNSTNLWPIITKMAESFDWILLENDLTDIA